MQPTFRTDLTCSREEQQGVVFYRIDDPETRTSFRLYEIEYLIAQKLNGDRSIQDVIAAVKDEYNFDISEADLQKFISQLESMGFVRTGQGQSGVNTGAGLTASRAQTLEMSQMAEPVSDASIEMLADIDSAPVDEAELYRLLRSAFLHIRQGYLVHARDYLLAARELSPNDSRVTKLVSHVDVVGDEPSRGELEHLWQQCEALFPDLVADVGPLVESRTSPTADAMAEAARRTSEAWEEDNKSRIGWAIAFLFIMVSGAAGMYYAYTQHLFDALLVGDVKVQVATLQGSRVPVFYPGTAVGLRPVQETWLNFSESGKVGPDLVKVGARVQEGQVVASLELPPKGQNGLKTLRENVHKAEAQYDKIAKRLEKFLADREIVQTEANDAAKQIKELRPKTLLKPDPEARKALETWKRTLTKANKKLAMMSKRERGPRGAEAKAKKHIEMVKKRLATLEAHVSGKLLRAPFAGDVTEVKLAPGVTAVANAQAIHIRNPLLARLVFNVKSAGNLQPGGEALVSVKGGAPVGAKVVSVKPNGAVVEIQLDMVDPAGMLLAMQADAFRLVQEYADPAFKVRDKAILKGDDGLPRVMLYQMGSVSRYPVQILETLGGDTLIRDTNGTLKNNAQVVLGRVDGQPLTTLVDGTTVQTPEAHP